MRDQRVITATLPSGAELCLVAYDDGRLPSDVSFLDKLRLNDVLGAVQEFAGIAAESIKALKPDEFELTFGVAVTAASGKLTALVVGGEVEASLHARLCWRTSDQTRVDENERP